LKCSEGTLADEVERIRAVREAIGPDTLFMLDMNAAYNLEDCIEFAHAVEPYDIHWLEEPLHWYLQPADFVKLAAATPIPLAHGERELTRFTMRDFIATGAIRFVQFDATRYAGFTEGLRVAYLAEQHGIRIAPHCVPEIHTHLCSAFASASFAVETLGNERRDIIGRGIYARGPEVRGGEVHIPDAPGFGLEIDWDFALRYGAK